MNSVQSIPRDQLTIPLEKIRHWRALAEQGLSQQLLLEIDELLVPNVHTSYVTLKTDGVLGNAGDILTIEWPALDTFVSTVTDEHLVALDRTDRHLFRLAYQQMTGRQIPEQFMLIDLLDFGAAAKAWSSISAK